MDRMSALDAGMFFAESESTALHTGSVAVFEGPAPRYGDLIRAVLARLPRLPRYRQRVRTVPLNLARPVWADDPHFQILYHVRHTAVPAPGGAEELRNLAGRVLSHRLDPNKPLWEIWLVEGLAGDRWAVVSKVHPCMVDGVGGIDLLTHLLDTTGEPMAGGPATDFAPPRAEPGTGRLLGTALRDAAVEPLRRLPGAPAAVRSALTGVPHGFGPGFSRTLGRLARPTSNSLNGRLGPYRRWMWTRADLGEVRQVRDSLGGTVNDVVLAAVTHGFRVLLDERGELDERTVVRALVPVSVRVREPDGAEHGGVGNRVSGVLVNLPVGEPDARRRLFLLRSQMNDVKRTHQAAGGEALSALAGFSPTLLALGSRAALGHSQPLVQTVIANVPGPRSPLYALGHRMVRLHPFVPIASGVRVGVAVYSYLDALDFGLTGDFDGMPDLDVLAAGIRAGFDELVHVATTDDPWE